MSNHNLEYGELRKSYVDKMIRMNYHLREYSPQRKDPDQTPHATAHAGCSVAGRGEGGRPGAVLLSADGTLQVAPQSQQRFAG
eukprot:2789349-Pleurochrysis_carterae.AAC.3